MSKITVYQIMVNSPTEPSIFTRHKGVANSLAIKLIFTAKLSFSYEFFEMDEEEYFSKKKEFDK